LLKDTKLIILKSYAREINKNEETQHKKNKKYFWNNNNKYNKVKMYENALKYSLNKYNYY